MNPVPSNPLSSAGANSPLGGLGQTVSGLVDVVGLVASRTVDNVVDTAGLALDLVSKLADGALDTLDVLDPVLEQLSSQVPALDLAQLKNELVSLTGQLTGPVVGGLEQTVSTLGGNVEELVQQPNALVGQLTQSLEEARTATETALPKQDALRPDSTLPVANRNDEAAALMRNEVESPNIAESSDEQSASLASPTSDTATAPLLPVTTAGIDEQLLFSLELAKQQSASNTPTQRGTGVDASSNPQLVAHDRLPPFVDQPLPVWQAPETYGGGSASQIPSLLQAAVVGFYARAPTPGSIAAELGYANYGSYVHSLSYAEQRDYNLDVVREQMRRLGIAEPKLEAEFARLELFRPALG